MILPTLAAVASVITVAIHVTGARGPALPMTDLPVVGLGAYGDVWPLDTLAHGVAGVAIGAAAYATATLRFEGLLAHALAGGVVATLAVAWEWYELKFWDEDAKGRRRWFEDTQADVFAVVLGAIAVGALVVAGVA